MTLAISGLGTKFRRWNGSDWADLAEINNISGPSMTREFIDVTSLDSTGGYREFIAGFRDGGTINFAMNFTYNAYLLMKTDFEDNTAQNYEVVLPDKDAAGDPVSSSFEFEGLVTELPLEIPTDDKVTCNVTIKINGFVTFNTGSATADPTSE